MLYISYKLMLIEFPIIDKYCRSDRQWHITFLFLHFNHPHEITIGFVLQDGSACWSYFASIMVMLLYTGHTAAIMLKGIIHEAARTLGSGIGAGGGGGVT